MKDRDDVIAAVKEKHGEENLDIIMDTAIAATHVANAHIRKQLRRDIEELEEANNEIEEELKERGLID